jgi:NAD(P)-dependent dehydrogenase (short-subunit alcohol dehydrogenase family)
MLPRTAVVTGAASGIGRATLWRLAQDGYAVIGMDKDAEGLQAITQAAKPLSLSITCMVLDVADETQVVQSMALAFEQLGPLDALATCAGVVNATPFGELSVKDFQQTYNTNVVGTFLCIREAAKYMTQGSRICTIGSVAGMRGGELFGTAAYAASKGAVLALTKSAARALANKGISVNCVVPGPTQTPMIEAMWLDENKRAIVENASLQKRAASPDELACSVAFLLSSQASNISGSTLVSDGGIMMY